MSLCWSLQTRELWIDTWHREQAVGSNWSAQIQTNLIKAQESRLVCCDLGRLHVQSTIMYFEVSVQCQSSGHPRYSALTTVHIVLAGEVYNMRKMRSFAWLWLLILACKPTKTVRCRNPTLHFTRKVTPTTWCVGYLGKKEEKNWSL